MSDKPVAASDYLTIFCEMVTTALFNKTNIHNIFHRNRHKLSDANNYKKYKVEQYDPKLHTYHINK